jgi:hypothetical protein
MNREFMNSKKNYTDSGFEKSKTTKLSRAFKNIPISSQININSGVSHSEYDPPENLDLESKV